MVVAKVVGRMTILGTLTVSILFITVVTEIVIDKLTFQTRDLRHLLKHSLGNVGTLMVLLSLAGYMAKKRWHKFPGMLKDWLSVHRWFATVGVALVGIHSGAHFKATIPLVTLGIMLVSLVSGFVGHYVYMNAMKELGTRRSKMMQSGLDREEVEEKLAFAVTTTKTLANWRVIHRPFSLLLAFFLVWHVVAALYYGG